jgi:hypothetical protein
MANFNWDTPDPDLLLNYVKTQGLRGKRSIEILSRNLHFLDVFNTEIGFQLLNDLVMMHSQALEKICAFDSKPEERMRYQCLEELIMRWNSKIKAYEDTLGKIDGKP